LLKIVKTYMGFDIDGYFFNGEVIFRLSLAVQIGVGRIINKDGLYTGLVRSWYGLYTAYLRGKYVSGMVILLLALFLKRLTNYEIQIRGQS